MVREKVMGNSVRDIEGEIALGRLWTKGVKASG